MSTSSEVVDSGMLFGQTQNVPARAPEKSNFSQTCNLLSQYLKEKGSLADLTLGMATSSTATMNLFPGAEKLGSTRPTSSVSNQDIPKKQTDSAQMTIFYAGQVIVFNDFPAEKAKEIMMLAGKATLHKPNPFPKPSEPSTFVAPATNSVSNQVQNQPPQPVISDLPIARKNSLTRFLEKRKDRITARAPYQVGNSGATANSNSLKRDEDSKSWLGLGAGQSLMQFQPQS